jgi:hypothetical protein
MIEKSLQNIWRPANVRPAWTRAIKKRPPARSERPKSREETPKEGYETDEILVDVAPQQ